jgi:hypothetical protein
MTRRDDSAVATGMNFGVVHLQVSLIAYVIPKWASQESEGP